MSVISRNHRSMQKHLYTHLIPTSSLWTYTITRAKDRHQIQPHTVMGLYSNHKYTLLCISKLGAVMHTVSVATAKLYKLILHRVVHGAQVSLILCLQYQYCSLSLSLPWRQSARVSTQYTIHRENMETEKQVEHTLDKSIVACSRFYMTLLQLWKWWLP